MRARLDANQVQSMSTLRFMKTLHVRLRSLSDAHLRFGGRPTAHRSQR
jgi:hypothetical protein